MPVPVEGTDLPLWGLEVDPDAARAEWSAAASRDGGAGVKKVLGGFGLGMLADQLADLKLGELLDSPPPGLDEAVAIAKVVEIAQSEKYARFSRVVVDTAPTGNVFFVFFLFLSLLLSLPLARERSRSFFDASAPAPAAAAAAPAAEARLSLCLLLSFEFR